MSLALDDYYSFMSDKLGSKPGPEDPRVGVQRPKAIVLPGATARVPESQIEVVESPLSDTVIERIFRPPNA
jgi:hypothetical protein